MHLFNFFYKIIKIKKKIDKLWLKKYLWWQIRHVKETINKSKTAIFSTSMIQVADNWRKMHSDIIPSTPAAAEKHEEEGRGTWKHAAFHVATTIATPAAYAPLPFALASLGWPLGL